MATKPASVDDVLAALAELRDELSHLNRRVAQLEGGGPSAAPTRATPSDQRISEEVIMTISAAIAAYLGVKPHIRQIRLVGGAAWAQLGRATIQASHAINH